MKKLLILLALLVTTNAYCTLDTINAKSKITNVTVFFSGAQITRNADIKLSKGKHIIKIDMLPREINPQSIQVERINLCKILSVKHQLGNNTENKKSDEQIEIQKKIDEQEFNIREIKNKQSVFDLEEKLLLDNSNLKKKDEGATLSVIKEAADFYRQRLNEIRLGKLKLNNDIKTSKDKIQELYVKLNEIISKKNKEYSMILIAIEAEKETTIDLNVKYFIESAGWKPTYDFRVDDITKPLVIVYNANVYQSTGEEWSNVNIKLSTGNPLLSGNKPELNTWYLGRNNAYNTTTVAKGQSIFKGRVIDKETNEAIPFASIGVMDGTKTIGMATSDIDGRFSINPLPSGTFDVKVSYIGYKPIVSRLTFNPNMVTYQDFKIEASAISLKEVVITDNKDQLVEKDADYIQVVTGEELQKMPGRSSESIVSSLSGKSAGVEVAGWNDNKVYYNTRSFNRSVEAVAQTISTDYISNSLKSAVTHLEYTIDIPYTVPSDGEEYTIMIKEVSLPVIYEYYAVPKIDNDAFLIAKIKDWTTLNLLTGKTSIYYQGTFTGESMINADNTSDTLNISLGRDRNIIVKREGNKEMSDKRIMGSNIKETIGWDITVKNNKTAGVKVVIEDQYPISEKKSIEVNLLESSNAKVDEKTGKITWDVTIEPDSKKVLTYKYIVKYPKELNLSIE